MDIQANQKGAATLLITVVMLILITIIVLFTSKVILVETKVEANNYRASQALMAANAGLDHGVYFFNQGGLDQHTNPPDSPSDVGDFLPDGTIDYPDANTSFEMTISTDADATSTQDTFAIFYFDNDDTDNPAGSARCSSEAVMDSGLVISTGYSDDDLAQRTISQCLGVIPIFKGNGPEQPIVSRGLVGSMGNGRVINRFSNINVWSGSPVTYGPSAATETFVSDGSITSDEEMISTELTKTQLVSSNILGNGYDVIENDPSLANLNGDGFFHNFFSLSREGLKTISQNTDQYTAGGNVSDFVNGKSGVIYVDGDASIQSNGSIGSPTDPAIVYVNGNLELRGGYDIHGVVYVVGGISGNGNASVVGSILAEGDPSMTSEPVDITGTLDVVFNPRVMDSNSSPVKGTATIVDGSWRDW